MSETKVTVVGVDISTSDLVTLFVKAGFASIPAVLFVGAVLGGIGLAASVAFAALVAVL